MTKNKIKLAGAEFELRTSGTQSQHANHYTMELTYQYLKNHMTINEKII